MNGDQRKRWDERRGRTVRGMYRWKVGRGVVRSKVL